jgi:tetratricopeptide (TPR) repeat protein
MPHIFVSHATADNETVFRIHDALEAATGRDLWLDRRDLKPGDNWQEAIDAALRDCESLLLILSRNSAQRPEVAAEWRDALLRERDIFIAVIDDIPATDIPARLRLIQWVDLHNDWDAGMRALVAAIKVEELPADAPVTTVRPVTGKIDRRLTTIPISGRDEDLAKIQSLLKKGPTAILGVGGVGKSRLAAELVMQSPGIDGAIWHTASDISRAEEVLELLREHFNLDATTSRQDTLAKLKQNKLLVVLDNAEDVKPDDPRRADYVTLVDDLVNAGVLVLLTSRAAWEDIELCAVYTPHSLSNEAARQIVLDMAAAFEVQHDLTAQADAIATAARLHPRLIEWAVRQMKKFPPEKVIRDLKELKSAKVQEALDEMIVKTLRQMTETEGGEAEAALKRLNVCRGGFTYEAAVNICLELGGNIPDFVEAQEKWLQAFKDRLDDVLSTLQTWQFITLNGLRYQVDPLVIIAVGEEESAKRSHYNYYTMLVQQHSQKQDYVGLDSDSANLEAAFEWTITNGDGEAALGLLNAVGNYFDSRGHFNLILSWSEQVVQAVAEHPNKMLWANAQNSLGISYLNLKIGNRLDNLKKSIVAFEAALLYFTRENTPRCYALTQNNLGSAYSSIAKIEMRELNLNRARNAFKEASSYFSSEDDPFYYAGIQNNLALTFLNLAIYEDQEANLNQAIKMFEAALGFFDPNIVLLDYANTLNNLGSAHRSLAEINEPKTNLRRAIEVYEAAFVYLSSQDVPLDNARTQNNIAIACTALAYIEEPITNLKRAITAYQIALACLIPEIYPLDYASTHNNLGVTYRDLSKFEDREENLNRAVTAFVISLEYRTPENVPLDYAQTQYNLGLAYFDQNVLDAAIKCWREADHYARIVGQYDYADAALRLIESVEGKS